MTFTAVRRLLLIVATLTLPVVAAACDDAVDPTPDAAVRFDGAADVGGSTDGNRDIGAPDLAPRDTASQETGAQETGAQETGGQETGATDLGASGPCAACAADEICVQLNDSSSQCRSPTATLTCRKVSAACRAELSKISPTARSCSQVSAACQQAFCPTPYQCTNTPPCGNESAQAQVWCYGP